MFEVGFSELLLIMGLALLVLGPEKLPKVVTEIGRWMGRARAMARQFKDQLELEAAESSRRKASPTTAASESPVTANDSHKNDALKDGDPPADSAPTTSETISEETPSVSAEPRDIQPVSVNETARDDERRSP
jgi:sec-independent protein translocase protein TatB